MRKVLISGEDRGTRYLYCYAEDHKYDSDDTITNFSDFEMVAESTAKLTGREQVEVPVNKLTLILTRLREDGWLYVRIREV